MASSSYGILKYGQYAERERGLRFIDLLVSNTEVIANGGEIGGDPIIDNGAVLDGSDNIEYQFFNEVIANKLTALIEINAANTGTPAVFAHYDYGAAERGWTMKNSGGKLNVVLSDDGSYGAGHVKSYISSITAFDAADHLIGFTWDGSSLELFIDGVKDPSPTKTIDDGITSLYQSMVNLTIGSQLNSGSQDSNLTGSVKKPRLFKTALTEQEILDYYNGTIFNYLDDAEIYLQMGTAEITTDNKTMDTSGNFNNATLGDGSTSSTFPTKLTARHGYLFDGVDDYFGDLPALTGSFTVCVLADNEVNFYTNDTVYKTIKTGGAFSGNLQNLIVINRLLTDMQKEDLLHRLMMGINRV